MTRRIVALGIGLFCAAALLLGLWVAAPMGDDAPPLLAASPVPIEASAFRAGFLPLLHDAVAKARELVVIGETREHNLFRIRAEQDAMETALAAADVWVTAHPPPPGDELAVAAYREGAAAIRLAMQEGQAGFLRFDFDRVARATETLEQGAAAVERARGLLDGQALVT